MELEKKDWENLKQSAEVQLKQLFISTLQFTTLLKMSEEALAKFAEEDKKVVLEVEKEITTIADAAT